MLTPIVTLEDFYPPDTLYAGLPFPGSTNWLPTDRVSLAGFSGSGLLVAGNLPIMLDRSFDDPHILSLLQSRAAGFAHNHITLELTPTDICQTLQTHLKKGGRVCTPHRYPDAILPPEYHVFDPQLLSHLNNKRHLPYWAGEAKYPEREMIKLADLSKPRSFPFVLKASTDGSSGGGVDVHICHTPLDVEQARVKFSSEEELLLEQWIPDAQLFCVQGAVLKDGSCRFLGSSEQVCDSTGAPRFNWIDADSSVGIRGETLAMEVFKRASEAGYLGLAGLDFLKDAQGNLFLIDLNFRLCFSSPTLAYYPSLLRDWKHPCWSVRPLATNVSRKKLLNLLEKGISSQVVMPRQIQRVPEGWRMVLNYGGSTRQAVENTVAEFTNGFR